jgi:hypothetical protein|tara:strand:+ start:2727 stop:5486 length:2760 start_codon:yes stop_codon:yes gene_type:complete
MAIQLSANTQQQQKAPFAAFDSTSRYRSGLSGVAEGLSKVGQLAQQGSNIFAKKDQQAQELLGQEAGNMYTDKLDEWQVARKAALDSQNVEAIEASDKAFVDLNPSNTNWNNYLNPTAGGKLKDKSLGALSAGFQTSWDKLDNRRQVDQNQAVIFNQSVTAIENTEKDAVDIIINFPNGQNAAQFQAFAEKNNFSNFKAQHEGLTTPTSKDAFLNSMRASHLIIAENQITTASTPEELKSRYDQFTEFLQENKEYKFNPDEIQKLAGEFTKQLKVVSDPTVQKELNKGRVDDVSDVLSGVGTTGDGGSIASEALKLFEFVDISLLDPDEEKKVESKKNLALAFFQGSEGEPSIVQNTASLLIKSTEENRLSDENIFSLLDENSDYTFLSPERKTISAALKNAVNEVEAKLALGDSTAWARLYPEYKKLLSSEKSLAQAKHYYDTTIRKQVTGAGMDAGLQGIGVGNNIVWQEFSILTPTIDMDAAPEEITSGLVNSVTKNFKIGALSTVSEASMRKFNSGGSSNDSLTALSTAMVAERVSGGEDLQAAASDVVNLITSYDNLTEDQKADVDLRYKATMVNLDDPEASSQNILELPQLIEFAIEGATGSQVAESLQLLLRGVLTSSKGGKSSGQQLLIAKQVEAKNIIPVFGIVRKTADGSPVQMSAALYNTFVDPNEESSWTGMWSKVESGFDLIMGNQPQIKAKTVVKGLQNAVLISIAKNGTFNEAAVSKAFANYSIAPFENLFDSQADKAARGEDTSIKPAYGFARSFSDGADNSGIPIDISPEEYAIALARGLGTNEYNPDKGFIGTGLFSGDGQAISRIRKTSRKIVDPATNKLVEVAGYTVELFNPTQDKYEPWGDENGSPVFVKESVVMNHLSEYTQGPAAFELYPALALSSSSAQTKMMADIVFEEEPENK